MAIKYGKKKYKQHHIVRTVITAVLLFELFLIMLAFLYVKGEEESYENLHIQTKQIKDDIVLQLTSDMENLSTMANFAAKLYSDGDGYDIMFESFKPIGMIDEIGILRPDNTFETRAGVLELSGVLSFEEEVAKGNYISGRTEDLTIDNHETIRSAVPIKINGETVGVLYGVISLDKLDSRYGRMADELGAQLFVYDKETGDLIIDTIQEKLDNISFLKERQYRNGSYEQLRTTDKGNVSFLSAYKDEDLYMHYSTIDELGWVISLGRYDSQVFANTHDTFKILFMFFVSMFGIIIVYILLLMASEKKTNAVIKCASDVRKELLETVDGHNNIQDALIEVCKFAKSSSAVFFDTDGEFYHYMAPKYENVTLSEKDENYLKSELFTYASKFHNLSGNTVNILCIKPDKHMMKVNPSFYQFLNDQKIREISMSATISNANHIAILATINSKHSDRAIRLAEKVSACFSMALNSKNNLDDTIRTATTDALTGALNRVAYKNDLKDLSENPPSDFSCIYVDVNELHICNNKYGHAAGDEMLLYIANTLKEAFLGHKVYRMGGDEFLVFCQDVLQDDVKKSIKFVEEQLKPRDYHVAVGMSYRTKNADAEEMVREAEARMYEAKSKYYQDKEKQNSDHNVTEYVQIKTGIREIDTMISVLKEKYNGIYRVSLDTDKARRILMPAYLDYNENEDHFSNLFSKYVAESVDPDSHRAVLSFLNYDALKSQLTNDKIPKISYKKNNGETTVLSVYKLGESDKGVSETLWVFAKE